MSRCFDCVSVEHLDGHLHTIPLALVADHIPERKEGLKDNHAMFVMFGNQLNQLFHVRLLLLIKFCELKNKQISQCIPMK